MAQAFQHDPALADAADIKLKMASAFMKRAGISTKKMVKAIKFNKKQPILRGKLSNPF